MDTATFNSRDARAIADWNQQGLEAETRRCERERACKHPIPHDRCEAALDETKPCESCGLYFCPDHLFPLGAGEACKACFDDDSIVVDGQEITDLLADGREVR